MRFSPTGGTRQSVSADIKCRRCIGVISSASALRPHVAYGERLLAVGDKSGVSCFISRIVLVAGHFRCRQGVAGLTALAPRRIATTHSQQKSPLNLLPSSSKKCSRICTIYIHINRTNWIDIIQDKVRPSCLEE